MLVRVPHGHDGLQELHELECVAAVAKVEVDAVRALFDVDALRLRVVLEDELLQVVKRPLVVDLRDE